jgi:hypothetical protein
MIVGGDVRVMGMVEVVLFAMATRGADSEAGQCAKRSRRCGVGNSMTPPTTVKTALHVRCGLQAGSRAMDINGN